MHILHGIFEDEAAAYATLLQFSEFYKTTGGRVPVWASRKCLRADRIMSIFSLFNIFDPDRVTAISVTSTHLNFFHLLEDWLSCVCIIRNPNQRQSFLVIVKNFPKLCNECLILWLAS